MSHNLFAYVAFSLATKVKQLEKRRNIQSLAPQKERLSTANIDPIFGSKSTNR